MILLVVQVAILIAEVATYLAEVATYLAEVATYVSLLWDYLYSCRFYLINIGDFKDLYIGVGETGEGNRREMND